MKTTRRQFLATTGAGAAALLVGCSKAGRRFPGRIVGGASAAGHRLRSGDFPAPREMIDTDVVVIGGGIAGLAAARQLRRRNLADFLLLELEPEVGGSSASGQNSASAYPWGAHYVPLPNEESTDVLALFEELGITRGTDASGAPIYDEEMLCSDPMERLFDAGRWQEGLLPQIGISTRDGQQYEAFFASIERLRTMRGADGRMAFTIPLDLSSQDPALLTLDSRTMADWMASEGYDSEALRWYVDYSCRDDYGAGIAQVSAWAGLHYFAARRGRAANADADAVVTWPEGNGWLVQRLATPVSDRIRSGSLVFSITDEKDRAVVDYLDVVSGESIRVRARGVICAAPRFVAQRLMHDSPLPPLEYSPWMVANVTVDQLPAGRGAPLAWDNVPRGSASLGYIVATHQSLRPSARETVLTHYWPLDASSPREERQRALDRTHADWCELVVRDLVRFHPGIDAHIRNIDVWVWGHGMVRPAPGFIWGETRRRMQESRGRVVFAHSDMSGISIFEEAFTRGTRAADHIVDSVV